jgi:TPR repeat protein
MKLHAALACAALVATGCEDKKAREAQDKLDRQFEQSGGIERDKDGRPYRRATGQYLDGRGGSVETAAVVKRPGGRLPARPETDVTRGLYEEATGNKDAALTLYTKACSEHVAGGCAHVVLVTRKANVPGAEAKAKALCDGGDGDGCYALGIIYETETTKPMHTADEVIALYDKGCSAKSFDACNALGMVYVSGRGGATRDLAKAKAALQRGCDLGDQSSCDQAGMVGG